MKRIETRSFALGVIGGVALALMLAPAMQTGPSASSRADRAKRAGPESLYVTSSADGTTAYLWYRDPGDPLNLHFLSENRASR
jgi:hypothetical protein